MRSNDIIANELKNIRQSMMDALKANDGKGDHEAFAKAFEQMLDNRAEALRAEISEAVDGRDTQVLASRGVRQLTSDEKNYYQKLIEAMRAPDPKQALAGVDKVLPKTVVNAVMDELGTDHPLLSKINFAPSTGMVEFILNTDGSQRAQWGALTATIVKELTSGFKVVDTMLCKLSAFIPVAKSMLDLGPEWLDNYVRKVLYEALANGLEYGIVTGTGKDMPIGMDRQVGEGVTVTGGIYPKKSAIAITEFSPATVGNILSLCAKNGNGKSRVVTDVVLIVNPQDYLQKVMPATTVMAPDGTYRNDVMPYPMTVLQSMALDRGEAIMGIATKYFAAAGTAKEGKIEYDDSYKFLEDQRVYLIKAYVNGFPEDNNAFQRLDISGLEPKSYKVYTESAPKPSTDATLSALSLGSAVLSPIFAASTVTYTATTSNATNTVTATPADAGAAVEVKLGSAVIENGAAAEWATGENTITVKVTAADGTTTKTYTVTVTKS